MIPRRIFSIWLSETEEFPPLIAKCLPTHVLPDYEYCLVTLADCDRSSQYVRDALEAKMYAKAADYLRMQLLYENGGWYCDADFEFEPDRNFDGLLDHPMVLCREKNNYLSNAIMGAEKGHAALKELMDVVEGNFKGGGSMTFAPGMLAFNEVMQGKGLRGDVTVVPTDYLLPYCWQDDTLSKTKNTIGTHWFNRSWTQK